MSNLTQTAANVALGDQGQVCVVQYGESVTQGMPIYLDVSAGRWMKAQATNTKNKALKIALTPGTTDGWGVAANSGLINLGATLTLGETYVVSATAGAICPIGDLTSTNYVTILGVAQTTSVISFIPNVSGVAKA